MIHELKILPQYYCRVADGSKTFEIRRNDRGFQSGDTVILREWCDEPITKTDKDLAEKGYTDSKPLEFLIGYIYMLSSDQIVFSLLPMKTPKKR